VAVVEALIAADAVVNIRTESGMDHYQPTPLHDAARAGHADVLVLLLDAGALVDAELSVSDSSGLTALAIAAGEGHVDAVRVLEQPQKLDLLIAQTPTLGDPTSIPAAS